MDAMLISARKIQEYLDRLVPPRPAEMQAMGAFAETTGFPIIGPSSGYLCYQVARMIGATRVFEMGSGYGYSTAWFAKAVKENGGGTVHHTVWDEEVSRQAQAHLVELGYQDVVQYHIGGAVQMLDGMPDSFDLIFNDIDKQDYPDSLPVIKEKLRPGGVLIIDNMLWGERVFDDNDRAPSTEGVREFTERIVGDSDWIVSLVPMRDGLIVAYKK
jgi:caffeoyl-CoA O-methyltransferase